MNYKEIVTKAVIGKGKKTLNKTYEMKTEEVPNTILGCWVINHKFSGNKSNDLININGNFDVNVWYSYDNDTKTSVTTKNFSYNEMLKLNAKSDNTTNEEIVVRSLKQPSVTNVEIKDGNVVMDIEKELGVELIGDTKVKVTVEDEEDEYDILEDVNEEKKIEEKIEEEVKEDYIN